MNQRLPLSPVSQPERGRIDELIEPLNEHEMAILRYPAGEPSNLEIADKLYLSVNTVKWYARSINSRLGVFFLVAVFNIMGAEFVFRGVLLPKLGGVFGKWDWVANGVLSGRYHWHQPGHFIGDWLVVAGHHGGHWSF